MNIKIRECGGDYREWVYNPTKKTVFGLSEEEIADLAVKKFFGRKAFFWRDNGLRDCGLFGQVCEPVSKKWGGGNTCLTGRVRIDIDS